MKMWNIFTQIVCFVSSTNYELFFSTYGMTEKEQKRGGGELRAWLLNCSKIVSMCQHKKAENWFGNGWKWDRLLTNLPVLSPQQLHTIFIRYFSWSWAAIWAFFAYRISGNSFIILRVLHHVFLCGGLLWVCIFFYFSALHSMRKGGFFLTLSFFLFNFSMVVFVCMVVWSTALHLFFL